MKEHAQLRSSEEIISNQESKIKTLDDQFQKMTKTPSQALKILAQELLIEGEIKLGAVYIQAALAIDENIFRNKSLIQVNCSMMTDIVAISHLIPDVVIISTQAIMAENVKEWATYYSSQARQFLSERKVFKALRLLEEALTLDENILSNSDAITLPANIKIHCLNVAADEILHSEVNSKSIDNITVSSIIDDERYYVIDGNQFMSFELSIYDHELNNEESNSDKIYFILVSLGFGLTLNWMIDKEISKLRVISQDLVNKLVITAIRYRQYDILAYLIQELDGDISQLDPNSRHLALMMATTANDVDLVQLLIELGADADMICSGMTPLMLASRQDYHEIVKILANEHTVNQYDPDVLLTPLLYASFNNSIQSVRILIDKGADGALYDEYGCTPLMMASSQGYQELTELLAQKYSNTNQKSHQGWNALMFAVAKERVELSRYLLVRGATLDQQQREMLSTDSVIMIERLRKEIFTEFRDSLFKEAQQGQFDQVSSIFNQMNIIDFCNEYSLTMKLSIIEEIIKINPDIMNNENFLLSEEAINDAFEGFLCIDSQDYDSIDLKSDLLEDTWYAIRYFKLYIMLICFGGFTSLLEWLMIKELDQNELDEIICRKLLFWAAAVGNVEVLKYFKENRNIDLNKKSAMSHRTPLIYTTKSGYLNAIRYLIENGVSIDEVDARGDSAVIVAVRNGNLNVLTFLMEYNADAEIKNHEGVTALMLAVRLQYSEVVYCLLNYAVITNDVDNRFGMTPLLMACYNADFQTIKYLLENHAEVNQSNPLGMFPLMMSTTLLHEDIFIMLMKAGALVSYQSKLGQTALMFASIAASNVMVKLLLKLEADCNQQNKRGWTALMLATKCGTVQNVECLLKNGADTNICDREGFTALMIAARHGRATIVEMLLNAGAEIDKQNKGGVTALMIASDYGHIEVVRKLLTKDPNLGLMNVKRETALILATNLNRQEVIICLHDYKKDINGNNYYDLTQLMISAIKGHLDVTNFLLAKGAAVDAVNEAGDTALLLASRHGNLDIVEALIRSGANIDHVNNMGWCALTTAIDSNQSNIGSVLIEHGAKLDLVNNDGLTALMCAAKNKSINLVFYLLEKGAKVNEQDKNGNTVLIYACRFPCVEIVNVLLLFGASKDHKNNIGCTPLGLAIESNDDSEGVKIVDLLLENGVNTQLIIKEQFDVMTLAVSLNRTMVIECFIRKKVLIDKIEMLQSALLIAASNGCIGAMRLLWTIYPEVNHQNGIGQTALIIAADNAQFKIANELLMKGAIVDLPDQDGWTALMYAIRKRCMEIVRILIDKGAVIDKEDKKGCTALFVSARYSGANTIRFLLAKGASKDHHNKKGLTALQVAARYANHPCISVLLEMGAEVNHRDNQGESALIIACRWGHFDIVCELVGKGANIGLEDNKGWNALMHASFNGYEKIIRLLLTKNATVSDEQRDMLTQEAVLLIDKIQANLLQEKRDKVSIAALSALSILAASDNSLQPSPSPGIQDGSPQKNSNFQ